MRAASAAPPAAPLVPAGFRMPAEEAPHARTWMQWPAHAFIHGGRGALAALREQVARLARHIAEHEPVSLLARPPQAAAARRACGSAVEVVDMPVDDLWARDSSPTFLAHAVGGGIALLDLHFNGWGGKQPHADDARIAERLAARLGLARFSAGLVGEGGALEVDGAGTVITTDSVLCHPNRNPGVAPSELQARLARALGASQVIRLPGLAGHDITDGHVDGYCRFVRPGCVLLELHAQDSRSAEARVAREALAQLQDATDAQGRRLQVVVLHNARRTRARARPFLNAYSNYYVCNGAVLMAQLGDPWADARAVQALAGLYPGRRVVALDVDRLHASGGGIHCATQQQPAGPPWRAAGPPGRAP